MKTKSDNRKNKSKNTPYKIKTSAASSRNKMKVNAVELEKHEGKRWKVIFCLEILLFKICNRYPPNSPGILKF
jgi:hypothetical protein